MSNRRYHLIETLPFPRATRPGHLMDRKGAPLHGTYERRIDGGYRAAIINNGTVVHRYDYPTSLVGVPANQTRSFRNLVHTLSPWVVPDDAERPVTDYPASEYPRAVWRSLWDAPIVLDSVIRGTKRVGVLVGNAAQTEQWGTVGARHGLFVREVREWTLWNGDVNKSLLVVRPGPVASGIELEALRAEPS